jgi:hypothetical protein
MDMTTALANVALEEQRRQKENIIEAWQIKLCRGDTIFVHNLDTGVPDSITVTNPEEYDECDDYIVGVKSKDGLPAAQVTIWKGHALVAINVDFDTSIGYSVIDSTRPFAVFGRVLKLALSAEPLRIRADLFDRMVVETKKIIVKTVVQRVDEQTHIDDLFNRFDSMPDPHDPKQWN